MVNDIIPHLYVVIILLLLIPTSLLYKVDVTIEDDGEISQTEYEIVQEDIPPFELPSQVRHEFQMSKGKKKRATRPHERRKYRGVQVSGLLGNARAKRDMQDGEVCVDSDGQKTTVNKAVTVDVGESVHIPCHSCTEKGQVKFQSMLWMKLDPFPNKKNRYHIQEVVPDMRNNEKKNRRVVTLDHTLIIKRAKKSDSGSYFCNVAHGNTIENSYLAWHELNDWIVSKAHMRYFYHIDVLDIAGSTIVDVSNDTEVEPMKPVPLPGYNLIIFTKWQIWGDCSVCGEPGDRKRIGICVVKKYDPQTKVGNGYLNNILNFAENGLPCQSEFLRDFANEKWLQRPNEMQYEECFIPCHTASPRTRRAISKSEILSGEKQKGEEKKVKIQEGEYLILTCPGTSLTKQATWVNGTKYVSLLKIRKSSSKRITFDFFGTLHFREVLISDSGTYSCWVKKEKKMIYNLHVRHNDTAEILLCCKFLGMSFLIDFVVFVILAVIKHINRRVQVRKKKKGKQQKDDDDNNTEEQKVDLEVDATDHRHKE